MADFPSPPDDRRTLEILERIRTGDDSGWEELYRRYHDELLFVARRRLGSRLRGVLDSEDVLQSVALEALKALPRFEHRGHGSLRAFLHTLVVNKIRDRADTYGAQKRQGGLPLTDSMMARIPVKDELGSEPAPAYFNDSYERLERSLSRLPEEMQTVLTLRRVEGLSNKEVAERLGKTDAAVRKTYSRALAQLSMLTGLARSDPGGEGGARPEP